MVTAKEFIHELRTRKVLNERHIAVIERSLLQPADEIPAADLANYLVEQMIISAAVSKAILDHLQAKGGQADISLKKTTDHDGELHLVDEDSIISLKPTSGPSIQPPQEPQKVPVPPAKPKSIPTPVPPERKPSPPPPKNVPVPPKPSPKVVPPSTTPSTPPVAPPSVPPSKPPKPPERPGSFPDGVRDRKRTTDTPPVSLKDASWRIKERQHESKWDTPLVRYGIVSLGLLILTSVVLVWLLTKRRADEVLAVADEAYQNGAYSQAIDGYNDFIVAFENHADVPRAKLRVSLAKIRLITEAKSHWDKALALLREELPTMSRLPDFNSEGRIELSAILPNIAEGLAAMAAMADSVDLIKQAETALELVEEHVPNSMRPFNQLQAARRSIELTQRRIARNAEIVTVKVEITALLETIHATASDDGEIVRQQLADCYATLMRYLHAHPEMQGDPVIIAIKNDIARTEASCQKWVAQSANDSHSQTAPSEVIAGSPPLPLPKPALLLSSRVGPALESSFEPATNADRFFVSYAGENVFAIDPATGTIAWRYHVGPLGIDRVAPLIISGLPNDNTLLADERTRSLLMVETATGTERFRLSLGETTYINPQPMWPINFVTTADGKLALIDLVKGERLGHVDLMQKADAPPCYDPERRMVVQPAHHTALHVFRYDSASDKPLVNVGIVPTGHLAGTICSPPVVHRDHLFAAEQTGPSRSTIKVFAPTAAGQPVPWGDVPVQVIPLDGLVKSPPIINGNDLLYMAERGEIKLISFVGNEPAKPCQVVAEGRIDDVSNRGEAVSGRFSLLADRSLWVADNRLQRFEIQPSRSRFIPQPAPPTPAIISQSPLQVIDGHLLQTFVDPLLGGAVSRSFALGGNQAVLWQLEFDEAVLAQPVTKSNNALRLVTVTGKLFDIPFDELTANPNATQYRAETYLRQRVATGALNVPVTDFASLDNGLEVLCSVLPDTKMTNVPQPSSVYVCDGSSPQSQVRVFSVPAPLTSVAVPLGRGIVLPLANGQLAIYSPADGTVIGNPLVARRTSGMPPKWSPMTLISKKRLAGTPGNDTETPSQLPGANDDVDEALLIGDADGLLRQVESVTQNNRLALVATKSLQLPCPIVSQPFVCGRNVIVADDAGHLMMFDYDRLTAEGGILQPPKAATVDDVPPSPAQEQPTVATQPAVNKTYGGVIVTGDIEEQVESPFVIHATPRNAANVEQQDSVQPQSAENDSNDHAPYQAWELDAPIVWGPFACGENAFVAVTEQNTFVTVEQADQPVDSRKAIIRELPLEHGPPIGRPFAISSTQLLFVTRNGTLLRYDLPQGSLTQIMTTGVSPGCGPMVLQSKIVVFGTDGAIYVF